MSKVVRSVKNVTKGYSSVQVKVRNGKLPGPPCNPDHKKPVFVDASSCMLPTNACTPHTATSNDPWGPTGTEMSEIAAMTFNRYDAL